MKPSRSTGDKTTEFILYVLKHSYEPFLVVPEGFSLHYFCKAHQLASILLHLEEEIVRVCEANKPQVSSLLGNFLSRC